MRFPTSSDVRLGPPTSGHTASHSKSDVPFVYHHQSLIHTHPYSANCTTGCSSNPSSGVPPRNIDNVSRGSRSRNVEKEQGLENGVVSKGGLSNYNEMNSKEWLDALNSPAKEENVSTVMCVCYWTLQWLHYTVITFSSIQHIVSQTKGEVASERKKKPKKAPAEEIPKSVLMKWFRQTFVPTYMAFVGQTLDPWDITDKQALEVMQKIWDATCAYTVSMRYQSIHKFIKKYVIGLAPEQD